MTIEILYFPDCPHYLPAVEHVERAMREEGISAEVMHVPVLDGATATAMRFPGSPTVRINGVDIEPSACSEAAAGLCCRTYRGGSSPEGAPGVALIREAIRELSNLAKGHCCVHK